MADLVRQAQTTLNSEQVVTRALQYFSTNRWKPTSQSSRAVTFEGKPPIPWGLLLLTVLGFMACIVPGIIMYIMVVQKVHRFFNLVISVEPVAAGAEVTIQYPKPATRLVDGFMSQLPPAAV